MSDVHFRCPNCGWDVLVRADDADPVALKEAKCARTCDGTIAYERLGCRGSVPIDGRDGRRRR